MAKGPKSVVNMSLLASIAGGSVAYISQADANPLLAHNPPLIAVDTTQIVDGNAKVWLTDAGKAALPSSGTLKKEFAMSDTPLFAVIGGLTFVPGEKKRSGRSGAKTIYPWATMEVGSTFFVPVSDKHPDPAKSMTSAVSSANMKYSEATGEKRTVTRAKRGEKNKAVLDANGNKIMETKEVDVMKSVRKFELRSVKSGEKIGNWTAASDGVIVGRVL